MWIRTDSNPEWVFHCDRHISLLQYTPVGTPGHPKQVLCRSSIPADSDTAWVRAATNRGRRDPPLDENWANGRLASFVSSSM